MQGELGTAQIKEEINF